MSREDKRMAGAGFSGLERGDSGDLFFAQRYVD